MFTETDVQILWKLLFWGESSCCLTITIKPFTPPSKRLYLYTKVWTPATCWCKQRDLHMQRGVKSRNFSYIYICEHLTLRFGNHVCFIRREWFRNDICLHFHMTANSYVYDSPTMWTILTLSKNLLRSSVYKSYSIGVSLLRIYSKYCIFCIYQCRSQWPRGLRRRSSAARLLRLWVRIPPEAWMFAYCEYCVLSGRGLCDGLITRHGESYRLWRVVVCDQETLKTRRLKPTTGPWKYKHNCL